MSGVPSSSGPRSRHLRRGGLLLASLLLGLLLVEAGTRGVLRLRGEGWDGAVAARDVEAILQGILGVAEGVQLPEQEGSEPERKRPAYEVHPYVGYLPPVGIDRLERLAGLFAGAEHEQSYDVFLFGGSVAAGFSGGGMDLVLEALADSPEVRGRALRFHNFAVPGFKQPQQVLYLTYLISRGFRPDLVLNLDGLNELRITSANAARGLEPTFPSVGNWAMVTQGGMQEGGSTLDAMLEVRRIQASAQEFGRRALAGGWFRSAIAGRWALSRMRRERAAWAAAVRRLEGALAEELRGRRSVAPAEPPDPTEVQGEAIACWFESSLAMHALCAARGARYVHLLQPTLHDEGSKPVSPKEYEVGVGEAGFDASVVAGYARLREGIARLRAAGLEAHDTSDAFADEPRTVYLDSCHLNRLGNHLLAARVIDLLDLGAERPVEEEGAGED